MADDDWDVDVPETGVQKLSLGDDGDDAELEAKASSLKDQIAADASNASLHFQLGETLSALDDIDDAIESFQKAVSIDGSNGAYLFALGNALQSNDDHDAANATFNKASGHAGCLVQAANYILSEPDQKTKEEREEQALGKLKEAIAADASNVSALTTAGTVLLTRNKGEDDIKAAADYFSKAIALDETNGATHAKLIQSYDLIGNAGDRDAARTRLHGLYGKGALDSSYQTLARYQCAQFPAGDKFVVGYDHFKAGEKGEKYAFAIYSKDEIHDDKVLYWIELVADGSAFKLMAGDENIGAFDSDDYSAVRAKVVAHVA